MYVHCISRLIQGTHKTRKIILLRFLIKVKEPNSILHCCTLLKCEIFKFFIARDTLSHTF